LRAVIRPTQEIAAGTVITDAMVTTTEVGAYGLSDRIVKDVSEVIGKVALEAIHSGEFFWADSLTTEEAYKVMVDSNTKGLEDGYCLVTIKCSSASVAVAGVLRPGNIVDVFECTENKDNGTFSAVKALDDMYVYDVLNSSLISLSEVDRMAKKTIADSNTNFNYEPAYVVIRCTEAQAQTLMNKPCNRNGYRACFIQIFPCLPLRDFLRSIYYQLMNK
jgi:Flp pilus assembly protein CpaB